MNISKFFGSKTKFYYGDEEKINVLSWPEIYFELGKIKSQNERLINLADLWNDQKFQGQKIDELWNEVFSKDDLINKQNAETNKNF